MDTEQRAPGGFTVRPADRRDLPALGRLGALLLRLHYGLDRQRFIAPGDAPERGYAWFLGTQLRDEQVFILVAEVSDRVVGYIYAAVEPRSWKELREEAGFVHDLVVDEHARGLGIGTALLEAAVARFRASGLPRIVLWTAEGNTPAQRLFASRGFRRTMVEMTREIGEAGSGTREQGTGERE